MKVITLMNEKGGVGKSTLSKNLSIGMALRGYRVLVIDTDAQGNTTAYFRLPKEPGFHNLMVAQAEWSEVLRKVPHEFTGELPQGAALWCLPSNFLTTKIAAYIGDGISAFYFRRRILELEALFDFVVIDTQPNPTPTHDAILYGTDHILIVSDCGAESVYEGVPETISHIQRVREDAASVGVELADIIGIVPNMHRANVGLHPAMVQHLKNTYGKDMVMTPLPLRQWIQDSNAVYESLLVERPDCNVAEILWRFVDDVIYRLGEGVTNYGR